MEIEIGQGTKDGAIVHYLIKIDGIVFCTKENLVFAGQKRREKIEQVLKEFDTLVKGIK